MSNYIQLTIEISSALQSEILIAILSESGFEGFEEIDSILNAFIPEEKFNEDNLKEILSPFAVKFSTQPIKQKNWNEEWEKSFQPVAIENFCAIRAVFHKPIPNIKHEIIITPKMSFGTGHHATTFLMIKAMEEIDFSNKSVLDFGTGTGVLSILAEKLGAAKILAIDIDEWSIENAKENTEVNHSSNIIIQKNDQINSSLKFDIILANINKLVILANLAKIRQQLVSRGVLIISGLLEQDAIEIKFEVQKHGFEEQRFLNKDGWICFVLRSK
ncbi:MAG: 50S ribosomal protein L11 methyltransferase [Bacteroidetes bacterium]|nr:50S ribosomal protein L11 methyltransferase [Bacteroidota bacterium]